MGTNYIEKVLNKKGTIRKRDYDIQKNDYIRGHIWKGNIHRKETTWGGNYIGGRLHGEWTIRGVDYMWKRLHGETGK